MSPSTQPVTDAEVEALLALARDHLAMDVAAVTWHDERWGRAGWIDATTPELRGRCGAAWQAFERGCAAPIAAGEVLVAAPDAADSLAWSHVDVVQRLGIRRLVGIPLHATDGTTRGVVCLFGLEPAVEDTAAAAPVLGFLADWLGHRLDAWRQDDRATPADRRRVEALLRAGEPSIVLQPVFSLDSGDVVSLEAFARFPSGSPDEVFARAHRVGLGTELELQAARNAVDLVDQLRPDLAVAVNVSVATLTSRAFVDLLRGIDPRRVTWELTEHAGEVDLDRLGPRLELVRAMGFSVAMDDVGTGYRGLERLLRLQPQVIKLDRAVVHGLEQDPARRAVVAAAQGFADQLGARLVAEGIETEGEQRLLHDLGVAYGQGYGLGEPLPVGSLPHFVRRPAAA